MNTYSDILLPLVFLLYTAHLLYIRTRTPIIEKYKPDVAGYEVYRKLHSIQFVRIMIVSSSLSVLNFLTNHFVSRNDHRVKLLALAIQIIGSAYVLFMVYALFKRKQ